MVIVKSDKDKYEKGEERKENFFTYVGSDQFDKSQRRSLYEEHGDKNASRIGNFF